MPRRLWRYYDRRICLVALEEAKETGLAMNFPPDLECMMRVIVALDNPKRAWREKPHVPCYNSRRKAWDVGSVILDTRLVNRPVPKSLTLFKDGQVVGGIDFSGNDSKPVFTLVEQGA